jgi:hypothetical protein
MPRPDDLPEWATSGSAVIDEPPTQKKQLGWEAFEKPSHGWFNYWWNLVYLWLAWLDENVVPNGQTIGYKYKAGSPATVLLDASPGAGGWSVVAGAATFGIGPPRHYQSSTTAELRMTRALVELTANQVISGSYMTATALFMTYKRTNAGDVVKLKLMRAPRDGSGATAEVAAVTGDSVAGTWVTKSAAFTAAIDPDYVYFLEAEVNPDDAGAASDCAIAYGQLAVEKARVE